MAKKEKTVEQQAAEFLDRERKTYDQRMKQAKADQENAVEAEEMFPEETSEPETVEPETKPEENNQGE